MDDGERELEQSKIALFTDPAVRTRDELAGAEFDTEFRYDRGEYKAPRLRSELKAVFEEKPSVERIMLICDGERIAVGVRDTVLAGPGTAGGTGDLGSADRAGLPGRSTRYRLLEFACARAGCGESAHASYYDDRRLPKCTAHGPMTFVKVVR